MTWEGCDEPTGRVARLDVARPRRNNRLRCDLDCRAQRRGHDVRQLTHSGQEGPGRAEGREPGGGELPRQGSAYHIRSGPGDGGAVDRSREPGRVPGGAQGATYELVRDTRVLKASCRQTHFGDPRPPPRSAERLAPHREGQSDTVPSHRAREPCYPGRSRKDNPRFLVTNLPHRPATVYTRLYCGRGDMENRLKELQYGVAMDRTSCSRFAANQFRLLLSAAAYVLCQVLQAHARATAVGAAQVW